MIDIKEDYRAPLIGIERHRLAIDGDGVTTLVAFHGCPLRCRYCLNPQCLSANGISRFTTPSKLIDELMIDNLYFLATGGGVTFGGGEPLLYSSFIREFAEHRPAEWNITIETSLNMPLPSLASIAPYVKQYIIDIKDMNRTTYKAYTSKDNINVIGNLQWLAEHGKADACLIRLPVIRGYNTSDNQHDSETTLRNIGFSNFDKFEYFVKE